MARSLPELHAFIHKHIIQERFILGERGIYSLLDAGRQWKLASTLACGGAIIFPHTYLEKCGHQVAAAVHACLDSGSDQILAIGVLHALSQEMMEARAREERGEDVTKNPFYGIQGPGMEGRDEWAHEFSLRNFAFLLRKEAERRGVPIPRLIMRYPFLIGGAPEQLQGGEELKRIARDSAVVATGDLFHHGIGYGESPLSALPSEAGGIEHARCSIQEEMALLAAGAYAPYLAHTMKSTSDARDVGQLLRYLLGPLQGSILDILACDTSLMWDSLPPTWVAASLVELLRLK